MINVTTLTAGDRIVVRSTDSNRDGFVCNVGRFIGLKSGVNGVYGFEYATTGGMVATRFLSKVIVSMFEGVAVDDCVGVVRAKAS